MTVFTRRLALAVLLATAAKPAIVRGQCEKIQFSAPQTEEIAGVIVANYYAALPNGANVTAKKAAADQALTAGLAAFTELVSYAVADGLNVDQKFKAEILRAQEIAAQMGEVARTDIQEGSTPTVSGSSSAASKTGLPSILSWAVEHGAVQREDIGTSSTISTSPYALMLLVDREHEPGEEPDAVFRKYWYLRALNVAATLDLDESNSDGSGDFNADKLSAVTTSLMIGDRSPRTKAFQTDWTRDVEPELSKHAKASVELMTTTLRSDPKVLAFSLHELAGAPNEGPMRKPLRDVLVASTGEEQARIKMRKQLQVEMCNRVIEPIRDGRWDASNIPAAATIEAAARGISTFDDARQALDELWKKYEAKPVLTLKHTWNRSDKGTDYSDFIAAADGTLTTLGLDPSAPIASLRFLLNASFAVNHDPDESKGQDSIRDYAISGSLEQSFANPLRIGSDAEEAQRMSVALTGRFDRQEDTNANIGVVQGRASIPLVKGFSLALALNYNTRTETDSDDEVRVSASIDFNGDTFASLQTLQALLAGVRD